MILTLLVIAFDRLAGSRLGDRPGAARGVTLALLDETDARALPFECGHWIREEQRYLMARDPEAQWRAWGKWGIYLILLVALTGIFALAHA